MVSTLLRFLPLAALVLASAGCGGEPPPPQAAAPARPTPGSEGPEGLVRPGRQEMSGPRGGPAQESESGAQASESARIDASTRSMRGTLVGRIYTPAATPRPEPLVLDDIQQRHCDEFGGAPDLSQRGLLTDAAGGLAEVVVWVDVPGDPPKPDAERVLRKRANRFEPHLLIVREGLEVRFENTDPCTSTLTLSGAFDLALPLAAGTKHWQTFGELGEVRVSDPVHPWLEAWVVVRPGAHVVATGRDGSFELAGLPPGEHVLNIWHPTLGPASAPFILEPGGTLRLELPLPAE